MLGKIEGGRKGRQRMRRLDGITESTDMSMSRGNLACFSPWGRKESDTTERLNNINMVSRNEPSTISVCVCVCVCVYLYTAFYFSVQHMPSKYERQDRKR